MNRATSRVHLAICVSVSLALASSAYAQARAAGDGRLPVPQVAKIKQAETLIKDLFKTDYARRGVEARQALAKSLQKQALETRDDPSARYVLIREACDLATEAGDVKVAVAAVDAMAGWYKIDLVKMKAKVLDTLARKTRSPQDSLVLCKACLVAVDQALAVDDYISAGKFLRSAQSSARSAKALPLAAQARSKSEEVRKLQARFNQIRSHVLKLNQDPNDPRANLAVGKYKCLAKGDWAGGLACLKRCSDPVLKDIATKELANPEDGKIQIEIGDGWKGLAAKERQPAAKKQLTERAAYWYKKAAGSLTGINKARAKQKLIDLRLLEGPRQLYLSDMKVKAFKAGYGTLGLKGELGYERKMVMIEGAKKVRSLSICPEAKGEAWIKYDLRMRYRVLKGAVALNDTARPKAASAITFKVIGDGREIWKSEPIQVPRAKQVFKVDVTGVDELQLQVLCPEHNANAQAVWVDPVLSK